MLRHVGKVSSVYSSASDSRALLCKKKKKNPLKFHHPESRPDKKHVLFYFVTGSGLNLAEITISKKCLHHPYNNSLMARAHAKEAKLDLAPSAQASSKIPLHFLREHYNS